MSGGAIGMLVLATGVVWGGLALSILNLHNADRAVQAESDAASEGSNG